MDTVDRELVEYVDLYGVRETARKLGLDRRTVQRRMRRIENDTGERHKLDTVADTRNISDGYSARAILPCRDCNVLIGSDGHYWPGKPTTAHKAFVQFAKAEQPEYIIYNGDAVDGASISRHPPIGWENAPSLSDELGASKERLGEIELACSKCERWWTLGNHDARYETRLAMVAAEYRGIFGIHLKDHFPNWQPAWSVDVGGMLMVKHRWKGGVNAAYSNTVHSGRSIATGHLHRLGVRAFRDYNGTRFGVETGTLADPMGPQFTGYTEDSPLDWHPGFVWVTVRNGRLLMPELVFVPRPGVFEFKGREYKL